MIIQQLDNSKVLIVLGGKDMADFALDYNTLSFSDSHSGKILKRLLTLACTKTGISTKDKKLLVEAVPQDKGCLILLTLLPQQNRKIFKIKNQIFPVSLAFETVEDLIIASKALYKLPEVFENSIYFYQDKYILIIEKGIKGKRLLPLFREFSQKTVWGKIYIAKIKENGKLIAEKNGIKIIGENF